MRVVVGGFPRPCSHEMFPYVKTGVPGMRIISLGRNIHSVVVREKFPSRDKQTVLNFKSGSRKSRHGEPFKDNKG